MDITLDVLKGLIICTVYYKYVKGYLFKLAFPLAQYLGLSKHYTVSESAGAIELVLAALSHILFCIVLILFFEVPIYKLGLTPTNLILLFYGGLIGIGLMAVSSLICRFFMECLQIISPEKVPNDMKGWLTIARAGWMRHHFHTLEIIPFPLALIIILIQVGMEEIVFRGVLFNVYSQYGDLEAVFISTILFMYMQIFHMPSFSSAMFPLIGALVIGIVHGILFLNVPSIIPLIISHIVFFAFAVL